MRPTPQAQRIASAARRPKRERRAGSASELLCQFVTPSCRPPNALPIARIPSTLGPLLAVRAFPLSRSAKGERANASSDVSGGAGPRARSAQGIGAIANRRCEADGAISESFGGAEAEAA